MKRPITFASLVAIMIAMAACSKPPQGSVEQARKYFDGGDTRSALIELKNVLQAGSNAEANFLLGRIYTENSHFQDAEKELVKARKGGVDLARVTPVLARALLGMGDADRVLVEAGPVSTAPAEANALIYAYRARAYLMRNNKEEALQSLAHADRYQPDHPESLLVRAALTDKPEEAMLMAEKAIESSPKYAPAWHIKGDLLRDKGMSEPAMAAYNKAVELSPDHLGTRLSRALLFIQQGKLPEAEKDIAVGLKQAPERIHVRYLDALLDFQNKRYQDSANKLLTIIGSAPDFLPARSLMGAASLALGQQEQAISNLKYVIAAQPGNVLARKLLATAMARGNDIHAAQQLLSGINIADDPRMMSLAGDIALQKNDVSKARQHFMEALKVSPNDPGILSRLATSQLAEGNEAEAMRTLSRAVDLDAKDAGPVVTLINALMRSKRFDEALKVANKHVAELPNVSSAHNLRGIVLVNMGQEEEARKSFSQALKLTPSFLASARNLARLDLLAKNPVAAKQRITAVLQHEPKNVEAWLALADLAAAAKEDAAYVSALESARQAAPANITVDLRLVRHWFNKNQPDKALVVAMETVQRAPQREDGLALLGMVHWQRGERREALAVFRNWTQQKPDSAAAYYALSHAELATGDTNAALRTLERALGLRPDFPEALRAKALILADTGKAMNALAMVRDIQLKSPQSPLGHVLEAEVLEHDKKPLEAARKYQKVLDMTGQPSIAINAAKALIAGNQGAEAEKILVKWVGIRPKDPALRGMLAQQLLSKGRLREAATHYEVMVKTNPQDLTSLNNLAWLYGELKHPNALAIAEKAYAASPESPAVMDTLGWLLVNQGDAKRGLTLLRQASAKLQDNAELQWHLANAYVKNGEVASAKLELERLINSGRAFPQLAEAKKLHSSLN
jgi:putative PEP-CTERM system TPR-repeat lipoprotein